MKELFDKLSSSVKADLFLDEPMSKHTTFKIGGPADILAVPRSTQDIKTMISEASSANVPYFVIGNGSNLLVSDTGIRGLVIKICGAMDKIEIEGRKVRAGAGAYLGKLQSACAEKGLSGLEFLSGIPCSVGGAIAMNAGSWGSSIFLFLDNVKVLTKNAKVVSLDKFECGFGYRNNDIHKYGAIIVEANFEFEERDASLITATQKEIIRMKSSSQPLTYPSAGCVFKNPGNESAGKLIEQAGLKGEKIGRAQVSDVHANFIVNTGGATAADVLGLINRVKGIVFEKTGAALEFEIKLLGF